MRPLLLFCTACMVLYATEPESLVRTVAGLDFGGNVAPVRELETLTLHTAGDPGATALEKLLLGGLKSARTQAAKNAFCRDLAIIGSDAAVPQLASLLGEPDSAEMARYALERIPGAHASTALREALTRTAPPVQTGIVVSLGRRRDEASVIAIGPLLVSKDAHLSDAAAAALGNIGNARAREVLLAAAPSPSASAALLQIAERSTPGTAASIYRRLDSDGHSEAIQTAALKGLARVAPAQAAPLLHAALKSQSARLQGIAIRELVSVEGVAVAKEIPSVPERARVQIIAALTDSARMDVRPVLLQGISSEDEAVRIASLNGIAQLGTAADIAMLAKHAATATGDEQAAARSALGSIPGEAADAAVFQLLPAAEPKAKVELIRAIGARGIASASDVLLSAAADSDRAVRIESVRALRETAGGKQVPALLALLVKTTSDSERKEFERTISTAVTRSKGSSVEDVVKTYRGVSDAGQRISLLNVLSAAGDSTALLVVREALRDPSADIQRAALNALSGWPTPAPMDDLIALARSGGTPAQRILALRGYIKLVQIPSNRTPAETTALLRTAMAMATRPEEKRSVLAVAQKVVCPESLDLARSALNDPEVAAEAKLAATTLQRGLNYVRN